MNASIFSSLVNARIIEIDKMADAISINKVLFAEAVGDGGAIWDNFPTPAWRKSILMESYLDEVIEIASRMGLIEQANPNRYKFRFECEVDVHNLFRLFKDKSIDAAIMDVTGSEAVIETYLSIEHIRHLMRLVIDGHVMVQTLKIESAYNGIRDYRL